MIPESKLDPNQPWAWHVFGKRKPKFGNFSKQILFEIRNLTFYKIRFLAIHKICNNDQ